jgi:hypothetical protein
LNVAGASNNTITLRDCQITGYKTGVLDTGGYVTIESNDFYQCGTPINASGDYSKYVRNNIAATVGSYSIVHNAGTHGLWEGNILDKTISASVTGIAGWFSGIIVKNNIGYVTRNSGSTSGTIASGTNIAHGLAGDPDAATTLMGGASVLAFGGAIPDVYLSTSDATNIAFTWTGGVSRQLAWSAWLPCDR